MRLVPTTSSTVKRLGHQDKIKYSISMIIRQSKYLFYLNRTERNMLEETNSIIIALSTLAE